MVSSSTVDGCISVNIFYLIFTLNLSPTEVNGPGYYTLNERLYRLFDAAFRK